MNLLKLSRLTGKAEYEQLADAIIINYGKILSRMPSEFAGTMSALLFAEGPAYEIVISGNPETTETKQIIKAVNQLYLPEKVVVLRPEKNKVAIFKIAPYTKTQKMIDGLPTVYICRNNACEKPLPGMKELKTHPLFKEKE